MVLGLKPLGKPSTKKKKSQVLDRTKALHGPWTQAYGETKYIKKILQVLDRTKALHGPRTQAYGETKYIKNHHKFWTEPRPCMVHGLKPMGKPST